MFDFDHNLRKNRISASEAAAILGISPWQSQWDIWARKQGIIRPQPDNQSMAMGRRLEPVVADMYAEATGRQLISVPEPIFHDSLPWLLGTPDRLISCEDRGLEIKTSRSDIGWGEAGTDEIPPAYIIQCDLYMAIMDYPVWDVAALLQGWDYRQYTLHRDKDVEKIILTRLEDWYQWHIAEGKEPEIDGSDGCGEYLAAKFRRNVQPLKQADAATEGLLIKLREIREIQAEQSKTEAEIVNHLKALIGEAEGIEGEAGRITWKCSKDSTVTDWEGLAKDYLKHSGKDNHWIDKQIAQWSIKKEGSRQFLPKFK